MEIVKFIKPVCSGSKATHANKIVGNLLLIFLHNYQNF